jgi:hypothetical protein
MSIATLLPRLVLAGVLAVAAGTVQPAIAQTANPNPSPAAVGLARELLALKGMEQLLQGMVDNVIVRTRDTFIPTNPQLARPLGEVTTALRAEFAPKKEEVVNEVARAYARFFTEAEMRDLLAFYKSPLGRKVLTTEPAAAEASLKRAQEMQTQFAEQVMSRLRAEMKKKGHDL